MLPSSPKPAAESLASSERQLDVPTIVKRCGNNAKFASQVLEKFQSLATGELTKLEKALAAGDSATAARSAHSLKSMTAYVAADKASSLAHRIEELGRTSQLAEMATMFCSLRQEIDWAISWIGQSEQVRALKSA